MNIFKTHVSKILSENHTEISQDLILDSFEKPKNSEFGDMALPCFKFAKVLNTYKKAAASNEAIPTEAIIRFITEDITKIFKEDNSNFDIGRFKEAVNKE